LKFYRKYLGILAIALLTGFVFHLLLFYINLGFPNRSAQNYAGWFRVKDEYASSINSPKLMIISGSNTLFGVNTEKIENELHLPTVNYGVAAGLNFYILHRALPHLHSGDTVILPLEYRFYERNSIIEDEGYIQYIIGYDTDEFKSLSLTDKIMTICQLKTSDLLKLTYKRIKPPAKDTDNSYDSKYLNNNGDMTNNSVAKKTPSKALQANIKETVFKSEPLTPYATNELESFIRYCQENNIAVYAAWPNYLWTDKEFTGKDLAGIHAIEDFYHAHNVEILGNYTDCLYDADLFYDSEYHLNEEGKRIHTDYLINLLKEKISQK